MSVRPVRACEKYSISLRQLQKEDHEGLEVSLPLKRAPGGVEPSGS